MLLGFMIVLSGAVVSIAAPTRAIAADAPDCGPAVNAEPSRTREINLVIDDSGSMFQAEDGRLIDRWSQAKYSLEVFAAMLDRDDTLNVYRMSDFGGGRDAGPTITLTGSSPASDRVGQIHAMQLRGGGTPYAPVRRAYADLSKSQAEDRWLVILTDGEFEDRSTAQVQADMRRFASIGPDVSNRLQVAFLAIGDGAASIENEPAQGIFFQLAAQSSALLDRMTSFSNLIFQRDAIPQTAPGHVAPDIDLREALVFAQGPDVRIGSATASGATIAPVSAVDVSWADNEEAGGRGGRVRPVPNKDLHGTLATFTDIPRGDVVFDVQGAQTIDIFFKPQINFGVELRDSSGAKVDATKIVGGEYTINYGFMDADCNLIEPTLLGDVDFTARVTHDGEVVADSFRPGDVIQLDRGSVQLEVEASYLEGSTSRATVQLSVLQPARATGFTSEDTSFGARSLGVDPPPDPPIALTYGVGGGASLTPFTPEEWASVTPDAFTVTSDRNIDFDVSLGDAPGEVLLTPRAPGGDVYATDTGVIPVHIAASHVYDEQLYQADYDFTTTVVDDIPWSERAAHWFGDLGWKLLLALLLLLLILGYVFKRRFSKKMKSRPAIKTIPLRPGARPMPASGSFRINAGRKLLPFVADTATLTYVPPGVVGFRPMKLKAGASKSIQLQNWKPLSQGKNIKVNGTDLNEQTRQSPRMGATTTVEATVRGQARYITTLNI